MTNEELLAAGKRLEAEFRRLGMHRHVRPLRLFLLAAQHGLLGPGRTLHVRLSEAELRTWATELAVRLERQGAREGRRGRDGAR